jgi:cold-inducible RNA-binding protein
MTDRLTGKSRGFAFVTMNDKAQAEAAITATNGKELNGRTLTVSEARPRDERPRPMGGNRSFAGNRR